MRLTIECFTREIARSMCATAQTLGCITETQTEGSARRRPRTVFLLTGTGLIRIVPAVLGGGIEETYRPDGTRSVLLTYSDTESDHTSDNFLSPEEPSEKSRTRRCETSPHSWVTMVLLGTRSNRGSAMPPVSTRTTVRGGDRHTSARCSYAARIARQSGPASKRNPPCSPWVFRVSEDTHNLSQWFTFLIAGL